MDNNTVVKNTGFKRVFKATGYSLKGIVSAVRYEAAFRLEVYFAAVMLPLAFWLDVSNVERVILIFSVMLVLIVELLNSGIEAVVDRIGFEHHELAGRAKDMASAAVFLSLILCVFVWASLLLF